MKKFKVPLIIAGIILAGIICFMFWTQGIQNKAISLEEQIENAKSQISTQEKRRAELIPKLAECVKEYDKHEYQTLVDVIESRGTSTDSAAEEIQTMITAVAEQYPELKSSDNYKELMKELSTTANMITNYRNNYTNCVKRYNTYARKFPNRNVLAFLGYEQVNYEYLQYEVEDFSETPLFE